MDLKIFISSLSTIEKVQLFKLLEAEAKASLGKSLGEWFAEKRDLGEFTVRLHNRLASNLEKFSDMPIAEITRDFFLKNMRGGARSWDEFSNLRGF